jgi:hypothetical protein
MTCECCDAEKFALGGIQTTLGYICYRCVRWIHKAADQTAALRDRSDREILDDIDNTP